MVPRPVFLLLWLNFQSVNKVGAGALVLGEINSAAGDEIMAPITGANVVRGTGGVTASGSHESIAHQDVGIAKPDIRLGFGSKAPQFYELRGGRIAGYILTPTTFRTRSEMSDSIDASLMFNYHLRCLT